MKWILKKFGYEIDDSNKKNRLYNNLDYIFAFIYFSISVYNARVCVYTITFFDKDGNIILDSITTLLLVVINIVILIRLYIKLTIQLKDKKNYIKANLSKKERYDKIVIDPLEKRILIVIFVSVCCLIIIFFIWRYGNMVVDSASLIAIICAGLTLFNDLIDIAINKYTAKIKAGALKYIVQR